jgi:hypothetical protein
VLSQYDGWHRLLLMQAIYFSREMSNLVPEFRFTAARGKELESNQAS